MSVYTGLVFFHALALLWQLSFSASSANSKIFHTHCQFPLILSLEFEISHSWQSTSEWLLWSVCECAAGGVLCPWQTLLPPLSGERRVGRHRNENPCPFTTVEVKHRVRAKCRWALLPWKGPLSRVSFRVSAERDTTESHSRLVFVCLPVFLCVSLKSSFYLYSPISQQKLSYDAFDVE